MPTNDDLRRTVEAIAAEVRAEMARQQKSQRDMAAALGMPQQVLQIRLVGRRSFRAEELALVAEVLGVPVTNFFAHTGEHAA
ncbi:helix-turn-helix transcriptional regulator [Micromonospora sp. Llam0]|uniref:helix-turn-helix domain-containing protein n=1 Tax=Micromonospora sp. Llam0 TaxID=2485143 RepID=UPI000F4ADE5B|nr:helix-turn-helix transcriptional regulator [Micromonospora sp. Llam0]